jgi:AraC-like DNA-binding protein
VQRVVPSSPPSPPLSGTVSVRVFWPFARCLGDYEAELALLAEAGIDVRTFADPLARISKELARTLIITSLLKSGDPALGLHAGECVEVPDSGPIDQITRHCRTMREALLVANRYVRLQDEAVESELIEGTTTATVQIRNADPTRPAVVNEFQVVSALRRMGFFLHRDVRPLEVHLMHERATNPAEYERVFRAPVRFSSEHNGFVIPRALLDVPAANANANLFPLFDQQAREQIDQLVRDASFASRVRRLIERRLEGGRVGMADIAHELHVSEATLRRRLLEESTTHKELLDAVRREHALSHVGEGRASLSEIGFRLGFSSPSAFARAFRRWAGVSPVEYRARLRGAAEIAARPAGASAPVG